MSDMKEHISSVISLIGDDITREGLKDSPARIKKCYEEVFSGYESDPELVLQKSFTNNIDYSGRVILQNIKFHSMCEHHFLPIIGFASISYIPNNKIVGISKLVRVIDIFTKRLQMQERITSQIANCIDRVLEPHGVAVFVEAYHCCMSMRGVCRESAVMKTEKFLGKFKSDSDLRMSFLNDCNSARRVYFS